MKSNKPNIIATARYSITDTCSLLGIHRNTLLNYTKSGLIKSDTRLGRKVYRGLEILRFWNTC